MSDEIKDEDALIAKRDQLLAEVKELKGKLKTVTDERDQAVERAETAEKEVQTLKVDNPVDDLLKDVFMVPPDRARKLMDGEFDFKNTDEGIRMFKGDEQVAGFDVKEVQEVLSKAGYDNVLLGTRASGAGGSAGKPAASAPQKTEQREQSKFGLR